MPRTARRTFDARPDTIDFRDRMFAPTLVEVPEEMPLGAYLRRWGGKPVVLDQGGEGACTGFGLAAVCNYLLRVRKVRPRRVPTSAFMLYAMARRYDEWPGEDYDGSSARAAMKGWHKHGVCSERLWPGPAGASALTNARAQDAASRPLGAYFRVNHKDLVAMHAALAEVGVLYASAMTHDGWDRVGRSTGRIPKGTKASGGHAFAIVGFDERGFWIQNSWGRSWGKGGFAQLTYEDWLEHGYDVWVARLGVPVTIDDARSLGVKIGGLATSGLSYADIRPHVVTIGNDGRPRTSGTYGNTEDDLGRLLTQDVPRITASWKKKRILLYAHGGLVPEENALQRAENYLRALNDNEVYLLAFVWRTDFWTTIKNILSDALRRRRTEGALDEAKDFMLDRLDDTLERVARVVNGDAIWAEMKENALLATLKRDGALRHVARHLGDLVRRDPRFEIHVAGHSAGSILLAPLVRALTAPGDFDPGPIEREGGLRWDAPSGVGARVATCTLWAPACTVPLFKAAFLPSILDRGTVSYAQFNLTDVAEQDDHCARIYNKSLLYLVSNALEAKPRRVFRKDGTPILGLDKFVRKDADLARLFRGAKAAYVTAPNGAEPGTPAASGATRHGDFDDDKATLAATLARILGTKTDPGAFVFARSAASTGDRRREIGS